MAVHASQTPVDETTSTEGAEPRRPKASRAQLRALGVPDDAPYVCEFDLDIDMLVRSARLTLNKKIDTLCRVVGIMVIVAGVAYWLLLHGDPLIMAVVVLLGVLLIMQRSRLTRTAAAETDKQLEDAGKDARHRLYWFCDDHLCVKIPGCKLQTFRYDDLSGFLADKVIYVLTLKTDGSALVVAHRGFQRGDADKFAGYVGTRLSAESCGAAATDKD
jgi:hypothetical protein